MAELVWIEAPAAKAVKRQCLTDAPLYAARTLAIAEARHRTGQVKAEKKRKLADTARTAAGDGGNGPDPDSATLDSTVKSLVKRHIMGMMPREPKSKRKDKGPMAKAKVSPLASRYHTIADFFAGVSGSHSPQDQQTRRCGVSHSPRL